MHRFDLLKVTEGEHRLLGCIKTSKITQEVNRENESKHNELAQMNSNYLDVMRYIRRVVQ